MERGLRSGRVTRKQAAAAAIPARRKMKFFMRDRGSSDGFGLQVRGWMQGWLGAVLVEPCLGEAGVTPRFPSLRCGDHGAHLGGHPLDWGCG
jgi:hypothetical protein